MSFLYLLKIGFPLFLASYSFGVIETFPRLYLINYGTVEQLGLFSPILIMLGLAILLPNAISSYMYPKMSFEYGQSSNKENVWQIVLLTAGSSFVSGIPIFLAVYFLSDYVPILFPKYIKVTPYLKISAISLLFIGYKSSGLSFSVLKTWRVMFANTLIYFIITVVSIGLLHNVLSDNLEVVAWSLVISYSFMFFFSLLLSYYITHIT
jgi:O-antigen/teichoic acid export membrane protein